MAGSGSNSIVAGFNSNGVPFASSSQTPIGILTIPTAGSYAVSATLTVAGESGGATFDRCSLGSDVSQVEVAGPGQVVNMALTSVNSFSAGSTITLYCANPPASGNQAALDISMIAIPGTGLTNGTLPS